MEIFSTISILIALFISSRIFEPEYEFRMSIDKRTYRLVVVMKKETLLKQIVSCKLNPAFIIWNNTRYIAASWFLNLSHQTWGNVLSMLKAHLVFNMVAWTFQVPFAQDKIKSPQNFKPQLLMLLPKTSKWCFQWWEQQVLLNTLQCS